ncbi:MAG: hypothetical protein KAR32_13190, partial [Candidatus Omnitrophica bacterium]|nr:hypothetical protein [Candidatus Omnitrophota bacterium]
MLEADLRERGETLVKLSWYQKLGAQLRYRGLSRLLAVTFALTSPVAAGAYLANQLFGIGRGAQGNTVVWIGGGQRFLGSFWYMSIIGYEIDAVIGVGNSIANTDFVKNTFLNEYIGEPVRTFVESLEGSEYGAIAWGQFGMDLVIKEIGSINLQWSEALHDFAYGDQKINLYKIAVQKKAEAQEAGEEITNREAIKAALNEEDIGKHVKEIEERELRALGIRIIKDNRGLLE